MKKNIKLVLALVLALMIVMGMTSAMASTLTIKNEAAGFTYQAFQILTGDKDGTKLSNVKWGTAIPANKRQEFLTALKTDNIIDTAITYDSTKADESAAALVQALDGKDEAVAKAFADVASTYATESAVTVNSQTEVSGKNYYVFTGLADGYYLVKNTAKDDTIEGNNLITFSEYIVQIVGDVETVAKNDTITIDKKIDADTTGNVIDTTNDKTENTVAIGDYIPYIVQGSLPANFDQYENYYYKFSDTMVGIDFVGADVTATTAVNEAPKVLVVKADGTVREDITSQATIAYTNQTTASGDTGKTVMSVTIANLKNLTFTTNGDKVAATDKIVVKYYGRLNNFALVASPNPNTIDLTYTNNPEKSGDGEFDKDENTSTTPEHKTETYVAGIKLHKTGDDGKVTKLAGAKFQLTGTTLNTVREVSGYKFVKSGYTLNNTAPSVETFEQESGSNVVYYALKDNADPTNALKYSFTKDAKTSAMDAATQARYVGDGEYYKVTYSTTITERVDNVTYTGYTNADGDLVFEGLNPGTYTLTELIAPAGYNLAAPMDVVITFNSTSKKFETTTPNAKIVNGYLCFTIDDKGGATLPSTGGVGTTIFYVAGSILVLAAAILLITKRRMSNND